MLLRIILLLSIASPTLISADDKVDFAIDVRPILADACFHCHGPDEESREADLRLDVASDAEAMIEIGDADASELYARIVSEDEDTLMPPRDSGKSLTQEQIATIRKWIEQGAEFQSHWAFVPPKRPAFPEQSHEGWSKNGIDRFVWAKLQDEKLEPSKPASTQTLVRRLSLDLTGLPPEPDFVKGWVSRFEDEGDAAYESLVEELLKSNHFGERWARLWLDAARYADSDGYEKDKPRNVWFYRDWVINSLNVDRPYDDFIIRQVAGDLLPNATQDDIVATGFLRNSMVNEEGGADPEQFRMEAMFDRMDAVGKAVLGLTIQCAQCHSHKYDPLQHEDYYRMFACLNSTHDVIGTVYTDEERRAANRVRARIEKAEQAIKQAIPDWEGRLEKWVEDSQAQPQANWVTPELSFSDTSLSGSKFLRQSDGSYLCQSYAPTNFKPEMTAALEGKQLAAVRLELLTHPNLPRGGPGRSVDGTWALSEITVDATLASDPSKKTRLKIKRAAADRSPPKAELKARYDNKKKDKRVTGGIEFAIDGDDKTAWTNEVDSPLSNTRNVAWFEFEEPFEIPDGDSALITVSLAQRHGGWNSDDNQTFAIGCYRLSFSDNAPHGSIIPAADEEISGKTPRRALDRDNQAALFNLWRTTVPEAKPWNDEIAAAWKEHPLGTTQLSLSELEQPRDTWLLGRGDFLTKIQKVEPGTPDFLNVFPGTDEPERLQFARWLVSRDSPTTARSIVNRVWQAYFGIGLVETSDDLGTQSAPPSHPELLDYLAIELMESGWSLKHLHRLIVKSATYRQSSAVSEQMLARDPYNRLLARGARFRVPAETVRDIALSASGLLDRTIGGRSVYPPAPSFLFTPPVSYGPKTWDEESDSQRYRRAMYTFRFRSVLYPMLENFDAVACNVSCVRRSKSNTPMQALTALNEPLFQECAVALAKKTIEECESKDAMNRIAFVVGRCLSRLATASESKVLQAYLQKQRERLAGGSLSADEVLKCGERLELDGFDRNELAAWTLLSRVVLNLDETITRE